MQKNQISKYWEYFSFCKKYKQNKLSNHTPQHAITYNNQSAWEVCQSIKQLLALSKKYHLSKHFICKFLSYALIIMAEATTITTKRKVII